MPEQYLVTASGLNLRSAPVVDNNIITTLPKGHIVTKLAEASEDWWKVSTILNGQILEGFIAQRFLALDVTLAGIFANNNTLNIEDLRNNKNLVFEIQKKLRNLGYYPGGQWINGKIDSENSRTFQGLKKFCIAVGLNAPTSQVSMNAAISKALIEQKQITTIFEQARDTSKILSQLKDIQDHTPISGSDHVAYLDRTIKNSPFELDIKNYPTYLTHQPNGTNVVSYGKTFQLVGSGRTVTFEEYPALGILPNIDDTGLDFLDGSIKHACVCVGSFVPGDDEIKAHWLGKKSLEKAQFASSTKIIGILNTICQLNKTQPNSDIDNCVIGNSGNRRYPFPALVEDVLTYAEKIAPSNSIAAMFKRFSTRKGLEDWTIATTGNRDIEFRGYYGLPPFITSPILFDTTLPGNQIVLRAEPEVGVGGNFISAYDLVRLISMLGWHLHLPTATRLPDAQWASLESVVRGMGLDTARYIDIALETLGLVNVLSEPVVISKLGLVDSALTYVAFVRLLDNRQAPAKLRTLAMALWTSPGLTEDRDNHMAVAVTEVIRRIFSEELA